VGGNAVAIGKGEQMRRSRLCVALLSLTLLLADCSPTARPAHSSPSVLPPVVAPSVGSPSGPQDQPPSGFFSRPFYFPHVNDDAFYNTVGPSGDILSTADDSTGVNGSCSARGSDITIMSMAGSSPDDLGAKTVNCMTSYGRRGGGDANRDGCSWKTGGITRIGKVVYLTVARQLHGCSRGRQSNGIQPSFDASIMKSLDGGRTWTNPWGTTSADGAAPPWDSTLHRYRAMFPGKQFSAPFFVQYGPGNTHAVDGANKYLYSASTDGYAYNGNYLRLARVPLHKVQDATAWQFYHGPVGGKRQKWTSSSAGATHVLDAEHGLSQPAIQYVPSLKRYVLLTFYFSHARTDFPRKSETPFTELSFYTAPKPWGPWTKVFRHPGQRSLWCAKSPCQLTERPHNRLLDIGQPGDWLGFYDPALIQKFVFTRPLSEQAMFICADWKNFGRYPGERLNRLHVLPVDLAKVLGG
jgi:hypothetical protein